MGRSPRILLQQLKGLKASSISEFDTDSAAETYLVSQQEPVQGFTTSGSSMKLARSGAW